MATDWQILTSLILLAINVGLIYFAVRLFQVFKGAVMGKPWFYIVPGTLALAVGSCFLLFYYVFDLIAIGHFIATAFQLVGGALILIGFYIQHRSWTRRS